MGVHYEETPFVVISVISNLFLLCGLICTIYNLAMHSRAKYFAHRKRPIMVILSLVGACIVCLYTSLWFYPWAEAVLILVNILLTISIWTLYHYFKETLMYFTDKYLQANPEELTKVIGDDNKDGFTSRMLEEPYPKDKIPLIQRWKMSDRFVAYLIVVEGYAKVFPFVNVKIVHFKSALLFMNIKTLYMASFCLLAPLLQAFQYLTKEIIDDQVHFKLSLFLNFFTICMAICSIVFIIGLTTNFKKTLKFEKFRSQVVSVNLMQGSYLIIRILFTFFPLKYTDYTKDESFVLTVVCSYSVVLCIFTLLQLYSFNASRVINYINEEDKMAAPPIRSSLTEQKFCGK
ncbi:unnamed protein product [Moneuplotes crassus]|uniref:Uncharacterized protein n=1 Tax=Euplotes crassus TaxID=5936 RepID=A0AAD2CZQ7_EUPCR|nr:unnamed protein product [Moneuplotes crassus]